MTLTKSPESPLPFSGSAARALGLALAAALILGAGEAAAQTTPQCPTAGDATYLVLPDEEETEFPPGTSTARVPRALWQSLYRARQPVVNPTLRIDCQYGRDDDRNRVFLVRSPRITVLDDFTTGIYARHESTGHLEVYIHAVGTNDDTPLHFHPLDYGNMAVRTYGIIEDQTGERFAPTFGEESHAIHVEHVGEGRVGVDFRNLSLYTLGDYAYGIYVHQKGSYVFEDGASRRARGAVVLNVIETERDRQGRARPLIATRGDYADAVRAEYTTRAAQGDLFVTIEGYTIATGGIIPLPEYPDDWQYPLPMGQESRAVFARHQGLGDIRVSATDARILTWGSNASAIFARHSGKDQTITNVGTGVSEVIPGGGDVSLTVSGGEIRTSGGTDSYGVHGLHEGEGDISISVSDASVSTSGTGVFAHHQGDGGIDINLTNASIPTTSKGAFGVVAWRDHGGEGDISITISDGSLSTDPEGSYAVWGRQESAEGGVTITAKNAVLSTKGRSGHGVVGSIRGVVNEVPDHEDDGQGGTRPALEGDDPGEHVGQGEPRPITRFVHSGESKDGAVAGKGDIAVSVTGGSISTEGELAHGVHAAHYGAEGAVAVTITGSSISTEGENANGVYARHIRKGTVAVALTDASISTAGDYGMGVRLFHLGVSGDMSFRMTDGEIRTSGQGAHGVFVQHDGNAGAVAVSIEGGANISAEGPNGYGIYMKTAAGSTLTVAAGARVSGGSGGGVFADGRGDFTAMIAGTVEGDLISESSGKDTVTVSRGGAVSGTILLTGSEVTLHGTAGRVWLEGGGTVTVGPQGSIKGVDGVAVRSNGAELRVNLSLNNRKLAEVIGGAIVNDDAPEETTVVINGVKVFDGANGAVATAFNGPFDISPGSLTGGRFEITERYAPRAGVYEALPGLLLRLSGAKAGGERKTSPGSPVSASVWGGQVSRGEAGSTVGASYDLDHSGAQANLGLSFWIEDLNGSVSVRHSKAQADVSLPSGKGEIEMEGAGLGLGLSWKSRDGWYVNGDYFVMEYDADLVSKKHGQLKNGVGATVRSLEVEAGMRFALNDRIALTPRVWAAQASASIDKFTDSLGVSFKLIEGERLTGGAGVAAETEIAQGGWSLFLRGAVDVESALSGDKTTVDVSGYRLHEEAEDPRIHVGLDALWRKGGFSLGGHLRAESAGSDDEALGARLSLGVKF